VAMGLRSSHGLVNVVQHCLELWSWNLKNTRLKKKYGRQKHGTGRRKAAKIREHVCSQYGTTWRYLERANNEHERPDNASGAAANTRHPPHATTHTTTHTKTRVDDWWLKSLRAADAAQPTAPAQPSTSTPAAPAVPAALASVPQR
jgi:hypothetical protein